MTDSFKMFALHIYKKIDFLNVLQLKGGIFVAQKMRNLWLGKR